MKRCMRTILLVVLLIAALVLGGKLLFRVFVTDQIMDKDGMENPWAVEEPEEGASEEEFAENTDKES